MGDNVEKIIFAYKYCSVKELFDNEVFPLVNNIYLLSYAATNFASAASFVSNINVTETHEIKELLELTFDIRKLTEKLIDLTECRTEEAIKAVYTGAFDLKMPPAANTGISTPSASTIIIPPTSVEKPPVEKVHRDEEISTKEKNQQKED